MHEIGALQVGMANFGGIGWGGRICSGDFRAGVHYPRGTNNAFLGADLWIGGVIDNDTLVSVTTDPDWVTDHGETQEFHTRPWPDGVFRERTQRDFLELGGECQTLFYSDDAVSEHDLVTITWDTLTDVQFTGVNRYDGRRHAPLGLEMQQRSYSWSWEYASDFIIVEYVLKNIGRPRAAGIDSQAIRELYVGLLGWGGVYYENRGFGNDSIAEVRDDLVGLVRTAPYPGHAGLLDTIDLVWIADNDGNPRGGKFGDEALPSAFGLRFLPHPSGTRTRSFNWWVGHREPFFDWGPTRRGSDIDNPSGTLGWPVSDRAKYRMMTNGEFDYPQVEAAISHEGEGWLPPHSSAAFAADMADGQHTWGLLSLGPFTLAPGDSLAFAVAAIGGENLHNDPRNFSTYFDAQQPEHYLDRLDFSDLLRNATWASWVYDAPGLDTDGDGRAGDFYLIGSDTVYYRGDGVPDFKGPPPPSPPQLRLTAERGKVLVRWNGMRTETQQDPFSGRADFEGYRVYFSRTGHGGDFALLAQRDLINYNRHTYNSVTRKWEVKEAPFTLTELVSRYDSLSRAIYAHPFHPDSFSQARLADALLELRFDPANPTRIDSAYRYFSPHEANEHVSDAAYRRLAESGREVAGVIRKLQPDTAPGDTAYRADGTPYEPFYEYEFVLAGLQVAEPVFLAVTAFDHGDPVTGVGPQESAPTVTAQEVWPIRSAQSVSDDRPPPGVYPNPYRVADAYNAYNWENRRGEEPDPERARRVTFFNVPDTCVVSIWSLDGDLVRRLEHRADAGSSAASVVTWDLITRNTQAIKTGIYIWSIESRFGTDVGKLVIIK